MAKITKIAGKKTMVKVGEDIKNSVWYYMGKPAYEFMKKTMKVGDEVTVETSGEKTDCLDTITKIMKGSGGTTSTKYSGTTNTGKSTGGKTHTNDNEGMKRGAVAHATSRVIIALQGQVDINNVCEVFNTVYDSIYRKISE